MRKIILTLLLMPLLATAENFFVDGAKWTYFSSPSKPDGDASVGSYYIRGTETALGKECLKLHQDNGKLIALIRTEGERVLFLRHPAETSWCLLYDFSLQRGEGCTVDRLDYMAYGAESPDSYPNHPEKVVCIDRYRSPLYDNAEVLIMDDGEHGGSPAPMDNVWVVGMGNPSSLTKNFGFRWIGSSNHTTLLHVSINGERIYKGYSFDASGSSAFLPYTLWEMECGDGLPRNVWISGGYDWDTNGKGSLMKTSYGKENGTPTESPEHKSPSFVCDIHVDGDRVYRITPSGDEVLAYDFAIQPGEVRCVAALDPVRGQEPTWVRCRQRSTSATFPGYDEIILDEFADEALSQRIGSGVWISDLGSPFNVLYNNRFAYTPVESLLTRVSVMGEELPILPAGAPSYSGIETVGNSAASPMPATFYNLQGVRVDSPAAPGVYIRGCGAERTKILVK